MDIEGLFEGRKHFTKDEWMDILIRSMGIEPSQLNKIKMALLRKNSTISRKQLQYV